MPCFIAFVLQTDNSVQIYVNVDGGGESWMVSDGAEPERLCRVNSRQAGGNLHGEAIQSALS